MSGAFEHSIKVPRLYKTAAKIVKTVREDGASLTQLVYLKQHPNIKAVYALALTSLRQGSQLDQLIRRTKILFNEPRLDAWLTRVLITELLWGKGRLSSECKPVQTVLSYEKQLKEELKNVVEFETESEKQLKKKRVEKPRYVRVNTLSMSVEEAIEAFKEEGWQFSYGRIKDCAGFLDAVSKLSGEEFVRDIHVPELLIFPARTQFYNHPAYTSGAIILQDKASCLPAYLLNAQPGSTVLDMCAAPGMKTTHLASILNNKGKIYAVEVDKRRYQTLCEIVASASCDCVETVNADVMTLGPERLPNVEYILVDPSCSGSGMVDRPGVDYNEEKCAPGRLRNLQSFQVIILRHALLDFPSAKRIVYSTCSLYQEENEQVIDEVLAQVGEAYRLVPAKDLMKNNWLNYSSSDFKCGENCLYARPESDMCNGFFVAVFERNFEVPLPAIERRKKGNVKPLSDVDNDNLETKKIDDREDFCEKNETILSEINEEKKKKNKSKKKKRKKEDEDYRKEEIINLGVEKTNRDDVEDKESEKTLENNLNVEAVPNMDKKAKRKRRESKAETMTETNVDNNVADEKQQTSDDETMALKKKKKKCKKSRNGGERELLIESEETAEGEAVNQRRNKSEKSVMRKSNELTEAVRDDDDNLDLVAVVPCKKKKRKKNKD